MFTLFGYCEVEFIAANRLTHEPGQTFCISHRFLKNSGQIT